MSEFTLLLFPQPSTLNSQPRPSASGQNPLHDLSMHIRQPVLPALETIGEPLVVDAELMQDRRLQIVDVNGVLDDVEAEVVRRTERDARLHAAARHPQREGLAVVIAPVLLPI